MASAAGTAGTVSAADGRRPAPTRPGNAYVILSAVLLVAFASMLLNSPRTPPPAIAEIAPVAAQQITEAPPEQTTNVGATTDAGGSGESGPTGEGSPTDDDSSEEANGPPEERPRTSRCALGTPPRQIEDPQSPPCVAFWQGDNGGATAPGVTKNEIVVGVHVNRQFTQPLLDFFNERFQFYGRKLVVKKLTDYGAGDPADPFDGGCLPRYQQATAKDAATLGVRPFAATFYAYCGGFSYAKEMHRYGIVYAGIEGMFTEADLGRMAPHVWQYPMENARMFANTADWICARFAKETAAYTQDPLRTRTRKFGIVLQLQWGHSQNDLNTKAMEQRLKACTGQDEVPTHTLVPTEGAPNPSERLTIVDKMSGAGVTSVVCLCDYVVLGEIGQVATSQEYFPEWLVNSYIGLDHDYHHHVFGAREHLAHTIGLSFTPMQRQVEEEPFMWALAEACPACAMQASTQDPQEIVLLRNTYRSLLMLSSGIQLAGPNLTPANFEAALRRTTFPNPDHPIMAGRVGFPAGHSMTLDSVEWWWGNTGRSPYDRNPPGAICYLEGGRRVSDYSKLPKATGAGPFQQAPCFSGRR